MLSVLLRTWDDTSRVMHAKTWLDAVRLVRNNPTLLPSLREFLKETENEYGIA